MSQSTHGARSERDEGPTRGLGRSRTTRSRAAIVALLLANATLMSGPHGGVGAARAAAPSTEVVSIEVLALSSNDAVEEASALTDAFKHALAAATGIATNGQNHALEAEGLATGCDDPMAPACAPKIAADIKFDRFVYGTLKKSPPGKLTVSLQFYDGSQSKTGPVKSVVKTYDLGPSARDGASPELQKMALELLYQLVGGPPKGKVDVTIAGPAAGASGGVYESGTLVGRVESGHAIIDLPSGKHTLELRVDGYASTSGDVTVSPAGAALQLTPIAMGASANPDWQLYGGIGAIGVGVIFLGIGIADSISVHNAGSDPTFTEYRKRWPRTETDTCADAKKGLEGPQPSGSYPDKIAGTVASFCNSIDSKQTFQYVFYGLGLAGVGAGTYLVVTDKDNDSAPPPPAKTLSSLHFQPTFGPGYGSLSISGSF